MSASPPTTAADRLVGLDTLRTIAIVHVVLAHGAMTFMPALPGVGGRVVWWLIAANFGVPLFFVLSGFLITRQLADGMPTGTFYRHRLAKIYPTFALAVVVYLDVPNLEWVVVGGLGVFGFAFAVNSSVHSYLVLAYAGSEKAAEDVGFYYAANAVGRFLGTLLSGLLYQWGGLMYALVGSALMLIACWLVTLALPVTKPQTRIST